MLSTPEGVDRAFAKLDTIKKDVVWWEAGAQPPQLLADGQVDPDLGLERPHLQAAKVDKKPFAIMWDHQALDWQGWNVVKGAKNRDAAYKFIAFAGRADRQADQTNYISYGPGNKEAIANTNPEHRARSADQSGQHEDRVYHQCQVLGRQPGHAA